MDEHKKARVDVTYRRYKHGRGFTWMAVVEFGDGHGARYPTSGSLATVSRWVTEVIEDRYLSQEIECVSRFQIAEGQASTGAGAAAQQRIADLATAHDEAAQEEAASALRALGLARLDVDYVVGVTGRRVGATADLNKHGGADVVGRPWLGSLTGRVMEKWRTSEAP
ncbi:hypothetical protein ACFQ9Z_18915 [Streptomyces sp. NPDC056580]|uniref:hypothetical protein n=1 Tax=Streptomyces sp. NPDC056580 TaxID=3345872 RepID=UPI0036CF04A7